MANSVNELVSTWNQSASLELQGEQEQQLQQLLNTVVEKVAARRAAGKQVVEQLQAAVQGNDAAAVEPLLQQVRQSLSQAAEGREKLLDQLDQLLQPVQRAKLLLAFIQQAQAAGQPVEQYLFTVLQGLANKQ